MGIFIDHTKFKVPYNLPETGNTEGLAETNVYIDRFEKECLEKLLGFDLAKALLAAPNDARWTDLKNGVDFTYNGRNGHWVGLTNDLSPLINYVWYHYKGGTNTSNVMIGTASSETDNNRTVSPRFVMIDCWNRMVDVNLDLYRYLRANKTLYPEWKQWQDKCYCFPGYAFWWSSWFWNYPGYNDDCIDAVFKKKNSFDL